MEGAPSWAPRFNININANVPASPHRSLRRLQSAQTLRSSAEDNNTSFQPSLISQQHKPQHQSLCRTSPVRKDIIQDTPFHTRARSNSDAPSMSSATGAPVKRPVLNKRMLSSEPFSLDRLIRDGPPDGDIAGGLDVMRIKILDQGIKTDGDGMVSANSHNSRNANLIATSLLYESMFGSSF